MFQENALVYEGGSGADGVVDEIKRKLEAAADAARAGDDQQARLW